MTTHSPSVSDIDAAIQLNPQLDVEALLLSAMLYSRDKQALTSIASHLSGDHFNNPHYGRLFDAISELVEAGKPHDPASVRGALIKRGGEQQCLHIKLGVELDCSFDVVVVGVAFGGCQDFVHVVFDVFVSGEGLHLGVLSCGWRFSLALLGRGVLRWSRSPNYSMP